MARTAALVAERLPVPGLAAMVIGYVWREQAICDYTFYDACHDGYYEICEELAGPSCSRMQADSGIWSASRGGHIEIVRLMIRLGGKCWNDGLRLAARCGHIDIVQLMIERGATYWRDAYWAAMNNNHKDIVKFLVSPAVRQKMGA